LIHPDAGEQAFISFSIETAAKSKEPLVPEFTIFHEIGHFQVSRRKNILTTVFNKTEVELMCDRYALYSYIKMLYHDKKYKTISKRKVAIQFEKDVRTLIERKFSNGKVSNAKLKSGIKQIVNSIMRRMKWYKIYESEYDVFQSETPPVKNQDNSTTEAFK
jgi:hypothetical protein